jgi:uncharacterized protein with PQ loop repeat
MIEIVGWVGSILFALCGVPQAIKTIRTKSASDFSAPFLLMWLGGEVCMITYAVVKLGNLPLILNYVGNLLCLLPIIYYKVLPAKCR